MGDMGLLEWLLVFDKITFTQYAIISGVLFVIGAVVMLVIVKKS